MWELQAICYLQERFAYRSKTMLRMSGSLKLWQRRFGSYGVVVAEAAAQKSVKNARWKSVKRRLIAYPLLIFGFWIGAGAGIAWMTVRPKRERLTITPAAYKITFERVGFSSSDGTRLAGWLVPAEGNRHKGVIVICHGVDSTREGVLDKARLFHKHGFAVLLYDARARGESGGDRCTMGYREVDDLLAAFSFVQKRNDLAWARIGVFGESLGAAVALMGTARYPQVAAVAAESPFACLDHAVTNHFHKALGWGGTIMILPVTWAGQMMIGRSVCDIAPRDEIRRISPRPILLIQDEDDRLCPPAETHELFAAASEPKQLWTVPVADHIRAMETDPKGFEERVIGFFEKALQRSE
jgi:fermentation-respiration switch protein FrsA (DUF1100 family)